jgi:hypothetical protein
MLRAVLGAIVLGMTAMPISADVNCGNSYVHFMERVGHRWDAMPGDRLATFHRSALRIFDACDSGHMRNPDATFWELENSLGSLGNAGRSS